MTDMLEALMGRESLIYRKDVGRQHLRVFFWLCYICLGGQDIRLSLA